jgi:hypothetical protein
MTTFPYLFHEFFLPFFHTGHNSSKLLNMYDVSKYFENFGVNVSFEIDRVNITHLAGFNTSKFFQKLMASKGVDSSTMHLYSNATLYEALRSSKGIENFSMKDCESPGKIT